MRPRNRSSADEANNSTIAHVHATPVHVNSRLDGRFRTSCMVAALAHDLNKVERQRAVRAWPTELSRAGRAANSDDDEATGA